MPVNQCFNKITDVAGAERLSAEYLHLAAEFHNFAYVIILNMMPMKAIHLLLSALLFFPLKSISQESVESISPPEPVISGVIDGHEYADLGLKSGTLWAICNLGAESRGEVGLQLAWGEIEPKDYYYWDSYKYYEYVIDESMEVHCTEIGEDICGTEYDAVRAHWGPNWKMPSYDEIKELRRNCWWLFVEEDGAQGYRLYGPNSNSIFMPFTSGYKIVGMSVLPNIGMYWSGTEFPLQEHFYVPEEANSAASVFDFDAAAINVTWGDKCCGLAIRPVVNREELASIGQVLTADDACVSYSGGQITIHANVTVKGIDVWGINGTKMLSVSNPEKTVSAANLSPGVYVVRLTGNNKIIRTQKIVVK